MSKQSTQLESPITIGTRKLAAVGTHQSGPTHPSPIYVASHEVPSQSLRQVATLGTIGACIYALSFTTWWAGYLGFFAIGPWAWLVIDARRITVNGYVVLYACGICMWLMLRYLASADTAIDWQVSELPLTLYLAGFVPAFVWLGRIGRETLRVPVPLWLPVVLVGLECLRTNLFGGFGVGVLGHATAYVKEIAQISDLVGSYGLSALMASSGATIAQAIWTIRKVRRLERLASQSGEQVDARAQTTSVSKLTRVEDDSAFTTAAKFRPTIRPKSTSLPREMNPSDSTERSMKQAVRRNRDAARERDLVISTLSIIVLGALFFVAGRYAESRFAEASKWKLFEGFNYPVSAIGGLVNDRAFSRLEAENQIRGLLVYATAQEKELFLDTSHTSILSIHPKRDVDSLSKRWVATMRRGSGQFAHFDLGCSLEDKRWLTAHRSLPAAPSAFPRDEDDVRIRVLTLLAHGATVEQSVNDAMGAFVQNGKSIDAAVVVLEPSIFNGAGWPQLIDRAVIMAALANRCPVISIIPDHDAFVAAGNGDTHKATAVGSAAGEVVTFSAMIDPRTALYSFVGEWPARMAALACLVAVFWRFSIWCRGFAMRRSVTTPDMTHTTDLTT